MCFRSILARHVCARQRGAAIPLGAGFSNMENRMDKESKEALQVAKELTCKFIETRTVSPGNFAEVFPVVYRVVAETIRAGIPQETERAD